MEKSVNEGRNKILLGLCFVVFFMVAAKCSGQAITRYSRCDGDKEIITKMPAKSMVLSLQADTTIKTYLSVYSDSSDVINYRLYVYFPNNIFADEFKVKIGFIDGGKLLEIKPYRTVNNYAEYNLSKSEVSRLSDSKFDYLEFDGPKIKFICMGLKTEGYFTDYVRKL
jgi:hypothetical protein